MAEGVAGDRSSGQSMWESRARRRSHLFSSPQKAAVQEVTKQMWCGGRPRLLEMLL